MVRASVGAAAVRPAGLRARPRAPSASPQHGVLLEGDGAELLLHHLLAEVPARRVDLDLPDVRVAPVLVVGEDGHLDEVRA